VQSWAGSSVLLWGHGALLDCLLVGCGHGNLRLPCALGRLEHTPTNEGRLPNSYKLYACDRACCFRMEKQEHNMMKSLLTRGRSAVLF
jgi:hypothetical protein